MTTTTRSRPRRLLAPALVFAGALFLLALGRWTAAGPDPAARGAEASLGSRSAAPAGPPQAEVEHGALDRPRSSSPVVIPREIAVRVNQEAKAKLEGLRPLVLANCWPASGLDNGARKATVTYNVTFDASGREIARSIGDDRRAPAPRFAGCLRDLQGTLLAIAPPGNTVGVSIAVSYP